MSFEASTTRGIVTAHIEPGAYMDAGRADTIAGLEFAASHARMNDAPRHERHADLVVSIDFNVETGRALAYLLAEKMGLPAFNERDWRRISYALKIAAAESGVDEYDELAERIDRVYAP